jgi:hypothetical protein
MRPSKAPSITMKGSQLLEAPAGQTAREKGPQGYPALRPARENRLSKMINPARLATMLPKSGGEVKFRNHVPRGNRLKCGSGATLVHVRGNLEPTFALWNVRYWPAWGVY